MSRIALGAAALIAASGTASVEAADLYYGSRAPYTVNQPLNIYSWAGPYLGGNLGWAWGSVDNSVTRPSGFVGGAQAGYNFFQTGPWVFGVEGDIQASGQPVLDDILRPIPGFNTFRRSSSMVTAPADDPGIPR